MPLDEAIAGGAMAGKEGFWRVDYWNHALDVGGWGLIALDSGVVVGTDLVGGHWDGTYVFDPRANLIDMKLTVAFAPAVISAVTGQTSPEGHTETYSLSLPNDLGREVPFRLNVHGQPLAVRFKKIRDFPQ